jgi:hypothetical protein
MVGGDPLELMPGKHTVRSGTRSKEVEISESQMSEVAL